jgi:hypothetical protein
MSYSANTVTMWQLTWCRLEAVVPMAVRRYWLRFMGDLVQHGMPREVGVTGWDLADCMRLVRYAFGPEVPPPVAVVEQPDLSDDHSREVIGGWTVGVPVWRGMWFPPHNLGRPEPSEFQDTVPRWWSEREPRQVMVAELRSGGCRHA